MVTKERASSGKEAAEACMNSYYQRKIAHDLDSAISNGTAYMEKHHRHHCFRIVTNESKVVDCLSKSKYGSYVDKSESNPTIQLQKVSKKFHELCHQLFNTKGSIYDLHNCLQITGN